MKRALLIIPLLLFIMPFVVADYSVYPTYGNDIGIHRDILGAAANSYNPVSPNTANTGAYQEVVTYDYDGDGITDIILPSSNNNVILIEGNALTVNADSKSLGSSAINPVVCDIMNTGTTRQYVGIFQNTSGTHFITIITVSNKIMTIAAQKITNTTNYYGNIVCTNFYSTESDNKNYMFWLDDTKHLHKAYYSGGQIVETISDPENGVSHETAGTYTFNGGSHTIAYGDNFDNGNFVGANQRKAIAYTAGDYIIGVLSDGQTFSKNWQTDVALAGTYQASSSLNIIGGVKTGNAKTSFLIIPSTSLPNGGNHYATAFLYQEGGVYLSRTFSLFERLADPNPTGAFGFESASAIHDYNNDGKDEIYIMMDKGGANGAGMAVYSANNLSTNTPLIPTVNWGYNNYVLGNPEKMYVIQNGNVITVTGNSLGLGSVNATMLLRADNFTQQIAIGSIPANTAGNLYPPQPIQLDADSYLDFLYTSPVGTQFYVSSTATTTQVNYPFSVTLNNTLPYTAIMAIDTRFNTTQGIYNYAVTCDTSEETVYNENFGIGYNFSERNVSTSSLIPPELYLTIQGFQYYTNISYFDVIKTGNAGVRDTLKQRIVYKSDAPNVMTYFAYGSDSRLSYQVEMNYTGSNIIVSEYQDYNTKKVVANYTIGGGGYNSLDIVYTPKTDIFNGIDYFTTTFVTNNATVGTGTTYYDLYGGTDIANAELYDQTPNLTITLKQFGLFKTKDSTPSFVQFQNGQIIVSNGITFTNPAPVPTITGDGFTVNAGFNNEFYATCVYNRVGTYTQRHFMSAVNVLDWSNYHDVTVTVTETADGTTPGTSSLENPPAGENVITDFFKSVGVSDTATAFVAWIFLSIIISGFAFALHPAFGILAFVAMMMLGVFLGMMPLWVIILFVIIAGGIFVTVYRKMTSGD